MATQLNVSTAAGEVTLDGDRTYVVGRGREADITIDSSKISRRHLLLEPGPDGWVARDTSANGVWRDGEKVTLVRVVGDVRLRLGAVDGAAVVLAATAPPPAPDRAEPGEQTLLAGAETRLAGTAPPPKVAPSQRARTPAAASPAATSPSAPGAAKGPSAAGRWVRLVPTLVWLAATGFALGALIALS